MLQRFEKEGGGYLLVATLCLLEVATRGLLESELLEILADEENLMPPKSDGALEKGLRTRSNIFTMDLFINASVITKCFI